MRTKPFTSFSKIVLFIGLSFSTIAFFLILNLVLDKAENQVEEKRHQPNEWGFLQRAFPYEKIDQKAYKTATGLRHRLLNEFNSSPRKQSQVADWEFAGPTNIGGRITDIEVSTKLPRSMYAAAASGGIFKSEDEGNSWKPIFDKQSTLAIGDIALAPGNEDIIYVGTGEANAGGGSIAYDGNGVYRSNDGGENWEHLGLESIGSVGKILIDPGDSDICYVAAMGQLFRNNAERGLYKTTDGGLNWEHALFINDSTGIIDMALDPNQPDTIYAAAWERIRRPFRRSYGGPSSGIYRSFDGGKNWEKLNQGLPSSSGRIGLAISASNPAVLYAIFTDEVSGRILGLFKSIDQGDSWSELPTEGLSNPPFMWWFGKIFVDPTNEDVVYVASLNMHVSLDGGNTWNEIFEGAHVDQHALYINPNQPEELILGNDGGVYISQNQGKRFSKVNGLPITQFYTCEIDPSQPMNLYGGTQDNGTNRTLTGSLEDWAPIIWGDGLRIQIDPINNDFIYAEIQWGFLSRSVDGGETFSAAREGIDFSDRRNWNCPLQLDPHNPSTLYFGTHRLYKSTDRAENWEVISPDLTGNPGQQNLPYGTLTSLSISSIDPKIIYTGSDDGFVYLTEDGGISWQSVSIGLPKRWVTNVTASPIDSDIAYLTFSGFRFGENIGHIYKTSNRGKTWEDISGNFPDVPVNDLIIVPDGSSLYIATDIGVFQSNEGSNQWELLGTELPNTVVTDLSYHPSTGILLAATYGRGLYTYNTLDAPATNVPEPIKKTQLELLAFPNPFHSISTIQVYSPSNQFCKLYLTDLNGKQIQEIFSGYLEKREHQFPLDATTLKSGIYLLKLTREQKSISTYYKLLKL